MTTRKRSLLRELGYHQPYCLSILSHGDALSLFCQHAFGESNFDSHPTLQPYGEGIVKKCDGLPLALLALGRLLRTRIDEEEWKEILNSEIWALGKKDNIFPALRLSYHDLPASLKRLFAYCSLFPKDYLFDKEELILLWMAEGFLQDSNTVERLGREYFDELLSRSFFQPVPNDKPVFVMHDLMNDLATSVAGEFFSRLDIEKKKELKKESLERHRHMSIVCQDYMVYEKFKPFKGAKNLRTFLALSGAIKRWRPFYISNKLVADLLHELPLLRVLSLSHLSIKEVPEFVGGLKHLRYLNLSHTEITCLPENVCDLYNLQTLILFGCDGLSKLPDSFLKLRSLRHLDIRDTRYLKKMPLGIGELKSLQTLSKIIIGGESEFAITELKNLQNLQGKVSIWGLDNVQNARGAGDANLSHKRLSELALDWGYGSLQERVSELNLDPRRGNFKLNAFRNDTHDKEVLTELKPQTHSLKKLEIVSYGAIEFPDWVGDPSFIGLTHVSIYGCEECTCLPRLGQLPSLKELFIGRMSKVKVVDWEILGSGDAFPSLEILTFDSMSSWEVWSTNNNSRVVNAAVFPCLQELHVLFCPNLVEVSLEGLPLLRVLTVKGCGHGVLTSLVHVAMSVTKLKIYDISSLTHEVWGSVTKYLEEVEEITIKWCNEIRYMWESEAEAGKVLSKLRKLDVGHCSNLVSLGEKEEEQDDCGSNLTSLRMLGIYYCESMEHCSCPNNIESLHIQNCDSLKSVSFPTGGGQKLKSLYISDCKTLLEKELGGEEKTMMLINSSMQMLQSIGIYRWQNLKSINELRYFINLTTLTIEHCPSMESFPDQELPYLNSLTYLKIRECPSMDASFPRGLWPPKLSLLTIGGLKKPILEWGPQNFPASLHYLNLYGGPYDNVTDFNQLSDLLPVSLTTLRINKFEELESVAMGLQHLTSLLHLSIGECAKTADVPEKLLPSLLSLAIYGCPNLAEKSSRGGSYWPLISLIPSIKYF